MAARLGCYFFFFFNDTATTEIYTLSLHDALPICHHPGRHAAGRGPVRRPRGLRPRHRRPGAFRPRRSEEHTSELQSPCNLVCRLLLEKKKYIAYARDLAPPRPRGSLAVCCTRVLG